jgi:hypothetical protein
MTTTAAADRATLHDLRHARQARRLGDIEWFDVLYRVYLFALVGLTAVVIASDAVDGLIDDTVRTAVLLERGPSIAGIAIALALAVGLRNGADGGPVSVESADVRHLLLSPIDRRLALARPIVQRMRSVVFLPALVLAIIGQLVAREVEGSRAAWAASAALFGTLAGLTYVSAAVLAHAASVPRWLASAIGTVVVASQTVAAVTTWRRDVGDADSAVAGLLDTTGGILFWGIRQRAVEIIPIVVVAVIAALAILAAGRLRLEPLERRGQLVSQLRFAATVQDLRTVVLLRRQLRAESVRAKPWVAIGRAPHAPDPHADFAPSRPRRALRGDHATAVGSRRVSATLVWRRGVMSLARLPISRLLRIGALSVAAGASASLLLTSSWLFAVPLVGTTFLVGLESLEPLAQEVDRPDLTESLPVDRGVLFAHHLVAPAGLLAIAGVISAVSMTVIEPRHAPAAWALAVPTMWAGAMGPIVTTVRDAPEPTRVAATTITGLDRHAESPFALPEFAGASNIIRTLLPFLISAVALAPVAAMRVEPSAGNAARSVIGVALCVTVMVWWILRRDGWAMRLRAFFAAGRAAT